MKRFTLILLALGVTTPGYTQSVDEATLVVRKDGREIGREEYSLRRGRTGAAEGTTIQTRARYPSVAPAVTLEGTLERREDGRFVALQLTRDQAGRASRYLADVSPRNVLRVHIASGGSESVREFPGSPQVVILADSVFGLLAAVIPLATTDGKSLIGVNPVSGKQVPFTARVVEEDAAHRRIELSGGITGTIWLDRSDLPIRIQLPSLGLEAVRLRR